MDSDSEWTGTSTSHTATTDSEEDFISRHGHDYVDLSLDPNFARYDTSMTQTSEHDGRRTDRHTKPVAKTFSLGRATMGQVYTVSDS